MINIYKISRIFYRCSIAGGCGWIVFGPVTPQDGLVTPPLGGLRADLLKKRPKFVKNRKNRIKIPFWEDRVQDGPVTPQDGLVAPPVWGLCADLSEKRPEYVKVMEIHRFSFRRCSKWLQIAKNHVLRFLPFYPLTLAFQALSCLANCRS